jgi:D-xylose 1-dehydrogenase (NADP+, D-xylono-1,5-lactone-forming)
MTRLRWGLLGTARINRAVIPVLQTSSRNSLEAVASRTADRAHAYAREWNIPRALARYEALLSDGDIDAVYISLPNSLHADWTVRALDAGKHVLCEKPLALTVDDVDRIATAASRVGRVAAEAFMYRHHPLTLAAEALVRTEIGCVRLIRGAFSFPLTRDRDIRLNAALGGGSLWDVGCYPVSYACLLAGRAPMEVFGWQTLASGIDVEFAGLLRFDDGVVAQFDCGFRAPFRAEMDIVGSEALVLVERPFKAGPQSRLTLVRNDTASDVPFDPQPSYTSEIEEFAAAALDGAPPRVPLTESRRTISVITALYESAASNAPVPV